MLKDQNDSGLKTPSTWKCLNLKVDWTIEDSNQNFLCVELNFYLLIITPMVIYMFMA